MVNITWKMLSLYVALLLLCSAVKIQAQAIQSNLTGYSCSDGPSPCDTYAFYRANAPYFLNLVNISDLFDVTRLKIVNASDLPSATLELYEGQPLLIPITCGCMGNYSQANITYQIEKGDTFYKVSTEYFQYLTTYQAVEVANPTLIPENLTIGVMVTFPIRCQCPSKTQKQNGISMQITYVVQTGDTLTSISNKLGGNLQQLRSQNGMSDTILADTTLLVPVSEKPTLAQAPSPAPSPSVNNTTPTAVSPSSSSSNKGVVIGASLGGAVVVLGIAVVVFYVFRKRTLTYRVKNTSEDLKKSSSLFGNENHQKDELLASVTNTIGKPSMYTLEILQKATQNFSPLCNIQGSVYKGTIGGKDYAIKQMKGDVSEELKILQKVNHSNLVRLEGCCVSSDGQSYLVYEYAENGSLNAWLHDPKSIPNKSSSDLSSVFLPWRSRLQVALDVANGLQYIHEHTTPSVVHKDVKSSNILLDGTFRAKIANFGMAKSGINVLTRHIAGTQGYMAPEYLADGLVTPKLDVFAFGVVLLELISGKEAIVREGGVPLAGKGGLLWTQIKPLMEAEDKEEKLKKWIDPHLKGSYPIDSVLFVAIIANACVEEDPGARPTLPEIVYKLSKALEVCTDPSNESFDIPIPVSAR